MMAMGPQGPMGPVMVLNTKTQRQTGRSAQLGNIAAARAVANIIRTTLGPRSMLKMILDPMGSVILTNDGHCILREVDVSHPAAKSMIELSRAQEEEVGDGTTAVIILAAEVLKQAEPFLMQDSSLSSSVHPTVLVSAYTKALAAALEIVQEQAVKIDVETDQAFLKKLVSSSIGTKFSSRWNDTMVEMALKAVLTVAQQKPTTSSFSLKSNDDNDDPSKDYVTSSSSTTCMMSFYNQQQREVDLKRYAKVEKIPGGTIEDCEVLSGVMFQKEPVHSRMRRKISNPRILLLDTPLEYKKGESATSMEISDATDWNALLKQEEEAVERMCNDIIQHKPDMVFCEKGVSDLAQHYLVKAGITAFRRLRKTDQNRIARATGATIVSRTDEITESDLGTACGTFEMKLVGGKEWFCYLTECRDPKACTIVLRGGSKDVLNEMERNLQDAMQSVRNVVTHPAVVPGGGATEMALSVRLKNMGMQNTDMGVQRDPFLAAAEAFEVIPRTLAQNCGVSVIRTLTALRAKHAAAAAAGAPDREEQGEDAKTSSTGKSSGRSCCSWGIHGVTGQIVDMEEYGIWEPLSVKIQTIQTAMESACMILRIDDIVSGSKTPKR